MAINAKPFTPSQRLLRSIFKGRPYIFSAEDLNRQLDAIMASVTRNIRNIGLTSSGWNVSLDSWSAVGAVLTANYTVSLKSGYSEGLVFAGGVQFPMQMGSGSLTIDITPDEFTDYPENSQARNVFGGLYLIAKKETITFAQDSALSGISSTEFPTAMPSSDTQIYSSYRYIQAQSLAAAQASLGSGEEVLGLVFSFLNSKKFDPVTGSEITGDNLLIRKNAADISDILAILPESGVNNIFYESNNSIVDALIRIIENTDTRLLNLAGTKEDKFSNFYSIGQAGSSYGTQWAALGNSTYNNLRFRYNATHIEVEGAFRSLPYSGTPEPVATLPDGLAPSKRTLSIAQCLGTGETGFADQRIAAYTNGQIGFPGGKDPYVINPYGEYYVNFLIPRG